eukprot:Skav221302  [mRNA]  locus=scaffold1920:395553:397688:- [translate_table: standard]
MMASRYGFRCLVMENVGTLRSDPTLYGRLQDVLTFCGLEVVSMGTYALSAVQPVERPRLLVVIKQAGDMMIPTTSMGDPFQACSNVTRPNLWNKGRWFHLPSTLTEDLFLDEETLSKYLSRQHMPPQMSSRMMSADRESAFEARSIRSNQVLSSGTCMAGYGNQHHIVDSGHGKYMYGSLKRTDHNQARFLHAVEILGGMGISVNAALPRANKLAHHAVGNSIAETHALIAILQGLKAWRFLFPWINQVDIPQMVEQHAKDCFNSSDMRIEWDDQWIYVTKQTQQGSHAREIPETVLDDDEASSSVASEPMQVAGPKRRKIVIRSEHDDVMEPCIVVTCHEDTTIAQVVEAEKKLNPCIREASVISDEPRLLHEENEIPDTCRMYTDTRINEAQDRILIMGTDEGISLRCQQHERLSQWSFMGTRLSEYNWMDALGNPYDPEACIGFTTCVSSDIPFDWPMYPSESEILVVHVHNKQISQNLVEFSPASVVECLMYGEQVLMGPTSRLAMVHDRFANVVPVDEPLNRYSALIFHWEDSHNLIKITVVRDGVKKEQWVPRGTRLFQLVTPQANLIAVKEAGFETPWDYPFFGPQRIEIVQRDESEADSPSATIPFTVDAPQDSQHMNLTTPNLNMGHVLDASRSEILRALDDLRPRAPHSDDPWATNIRYQQLWEMGHVMADDEMSYILRIMETTAQCLVRGVFKWEHDGSK